MIFSLFKKPKQAKEIAAAKKPINAEPSINEMENSDVLFSKLIHLNSQKQEKQLCIRIAMLCNEGKISTIKIKQNISQIEHVLQIALLIENTDALSQLCPTANEKLFLQFAQEGFTAKSRSQSFNRLSQIESFETLMSQSKGKDKTIYRAAQEKVNQYNQEKEALLDIQNQVAHSLESINKLATSTYAPQYEAKLELLIQTWQQHIEHEDTRFHPSQAQLKQFDQAKLACENTIFEIQEAQPIQPSNTPDEPVAEAVSKFDNDKETQLIETCKNACLDLIDNQNDEAFEALQLLFVETFKENLSDSAIKELESLQSFAEDEKTYQRDAQLALSLRHLIIH
ncbi:hypothetical protein [Marinicellulosiphila megalodicopiae]|uniref:hypothetical protein n=1 Tax=Marinicellulosiphila megalodicopiae TaxID=2724896 RepID=UPI003BB20168